MILLNLIVSTSNPNSGRLIFGHWVIILGVYLMPLSLWMKGLGENRFYVSFVVFCLGLALNYERFMSLLTSSHRDYLQSSFTEGSNAFADFFLPPMIIGIVFAFLTLFIYRLMPDKEKNSELKKHDESLIDN